MIAAHQHSASGERRAVPDPSKMPRQMVGAAPPTPPQNGVTQPPGGREIAPQHGAHPQALNERVALAAQRESITEFPLGCRDAAGAIERLTARLVPAGGGEAWRPRCRIMHVRRPAKWLDWTSTLPGSRTA